ncbi:MAG: hypothetical protein ACP5KE_06445 [Candidatus Methanodesulfokora sp.]
MSRKAVNLEAGNILMGTTSFLSFYLPDEWRAFPIGVAEVESSRKTEGRTWVTNGYMMVGLSSDKGGEILMTVKASEPIRKFDPEKWVHDKAKRAEMHGIITVNGHKCGYVVNKVEKGLLRREKLIGIIFCFFCDVTRRKIEIKLIGRKKEDIMLFKEIMSDLSCH